MNIDDPKRFSFGKNWKNFLNHLNEERILEAEKSLKNKLGIQNLKGKTFLDIGCGSGLFSLAAHRLGATVFSFDYDIDSVNCTRYLQETFGNGNNWSVEKGSVLDKKFLKKFSHIDIVYSWGVLHHTGHMIEAFENVSSLVRNPGGILFISIYNDQGLPSRVWKKIKKRYVSSNFIIRFFLVSFSLPFLWGPRVILDFIKFGNPLKTLISYGKNNRGMSAWHDLIDWVGGFPFEVAKPEEVFDFFKTKGFQLEKLKTSQGRLGCNEFILIKKQ